MFLLLQNLPEQFWTHEASKMGTGFVSGEKFGRELMLTTHNIERRV
jgi:hypothetical protein